MNELLNLFTEWVVFPTFILAIFVGCVSIWVMIYNLVIMFFKDDYRN